MMIKSIEYDQNVILQSILDLNNIEKFDADLSYGNGGFYKKIPRPFWRFDLDDNLPDTITCSSTETPLDDEQISSCVFDPPFLTYVKSAREHNSVMAKRFGGYWAYQELEDHYKATLVEANRILKKKGIMVFKCQDIIHNHKMHPTHINVVNWSKGLFRLKDMFILAAKHRMGMPEKDGVAKRVQKHARVFHSYFLVLEKSGKR
jgi:hypothetical protein